MISAQEVIAALDLKPLPGEGGYFRETYRAPGRVFTRRGTRSPATAIYYLITPDSFSALHCLPADEIFHFYLGDPVRMLQLDPDADEGRLVILGKNILEGQEPQVIVPRGVWQGSCLVDGGRFALLGTTMAPGFDFADYEAGDREKLRSEFPEFAEWIERLTAGGA
jgi:uncharacterized protein